MRSSAKVFSVKDSGEAYLYPDDGMATGVGGARRLNISDLPATLEYLVLHSSVHFPRLIAEHHRFFPLRPSIFRASLGIGAEINVSAVRLIN